MAESESQKLSASYNSPENPPFAVAESLPALAASPTVDEKTRYLNGLREAITSAQDQINKELTQRMEEDKARLGNGLGGAAKVDDAKEEENYGEEVVPEDD